MKKILSPKIYAVSYFICLFKGPTPASFCLFIFVLFKHKLTEKTVSVSGIQTWIVWVKGKHADHLTTTTAHSYLICYYTNHFVKNKQQKIVINILIVEAFWM